MVAAVCRLFGFAASLKGALVLAEVFLAFIAAHGTVAAFIKTVGVAEMGNLPANQKDYREDAGGENQGAFQYHKRRTYHDVVPVENTAGGAAAVMHHPGLEGAEEQDTDDVADAIKTGETDHENRADHTFPIEEIEHAVQSQPGEQNQKCSAIGITDLLSGDFLAGRAESAGKLFLTAQTFHFGRKESGDHGDHQQEPNHGQRSDAEGAGEKIGLKCCGINQRLSQ